MRSAVLILALLLVLGGAFYFVVVRDRPVVHGVAATLPTTRRMVPTTATAGGTGEGAIGPSSGVWLESRDPSGRVASEFLFEQLNPRKDGAVDVVRPQARFYGKSGGLMTLDGVSGTVAYSQAGNRDDAQAMGTATPTNGTLKDVIIQFYDEVDDAEPSITATVPALRFDAVDNRIATVDSVIDGKGVLAEQVPVTVRGRDYEFDGYGLVMRWNDRDGRLEQLVINRGERLLVRDVSRFTAARPAAAASRTPTAPRPIPAPEPAEPPAAPATRLSREARERREANGRAARTPAPAAPATSPSSRELYHATFDRDVHVTRSGAEVALADVMSVVIPLSKTSSAPKATTVTERPAGPTTRASADRGRSTWRPATSRPAREKASAVPATSPSASPSTRPVEPLEIRWTGKLTVRPVETEPTRVADGAMVEFVGAPARVMQEGAAVEGRLIHVEPDTGRVRIEPGGPVKSIVLTGADGGQLRSRNALLIDQPAGRATIEGGGTLTAPPAKAGTTQPSQQASVKWSRRLELALENDQGTTGQSWLRAATIEGDARVEAESFAMSGDTVALGFDRPTAGTKKPAADEGLAMPAPDAQQLRLVTARGNARIEAGPVDKRRSLAGQELRLGFAAGADGPALTTLAGNGDVAMIDADGTEFASQSLDVATEPTSLIATTQPAASTQPTDAMAMIRHLDARGDVRLKRADGTAAAGDRLTLLETGGEKRLALDGTPARAGSPRGEVIATRIEIDPQTRDVNVPVGGSIASADPAKPGQTMAIGWDRSMALDAAAGTCLIDGHVKIDSLDARGTRMHAKSGSALVAFDPASIAATKPSTTSPVTSRPTVGDSLRSLTLRDDVVLDVDSADGRQSNLETKVLSVDVQKNLITADQPGRMRMIDHPQASHPTTLPATTEPSTAPATLATTTRLAKTAKGPAAMAVQWNGALRWDLKPGTLAMTGGVRIGYDREGKNDRINIDGDRLFGTLTPIDLTARNDAGPTSVELLTIRVVGNVFVSSKLAKFDAATLEYDLSKTTAQAAGDAGRDVEVLDSANRSHVSFSAITWNVETGAIEDFRNISGQLRR